MIEGRIVWDGSRCIGCKSCEAACAECDDHKGKPNVHVEEIEALTKHTSPTVCMHCQSCAWGCPTEAIVVDGDGIVHTAIASRCISCGNCALACPFGVPRVTVGVTPMRKCDLCFARTGVGLEPACASVCPSGALFFGKSDDFVTERPGAAITRVVHIGRERVETRNAIVVGRGDSELTLESPALIALEFERDE